MKMVKNLITSIIIGSTALAVPMMANAKAEDGAFKVTDKPITLDIHFHTKSMFTIITGLLKKKRLV